MRVDLSRIQDLTRPRPCKLYTLSRLTSADEIVLLTSGRLGKQAGVTDFEYHGLVGTDGVWMIEELQRRGFPINNITLVRDEINSSEVICRCLLPPSCPPNIHTHKRIYIRSYLHRYHQDVPSFKLKSVPERIL